MIQDKGIEFGMEGPMMTGTWINPTTGHKFTVKDCFFQDNQFLVQTTDGQLLDYNTIQSYIQCTDQNGKEVPADIPIQQSQKSQIPHEVMEQLAQDSTYDENGILAEDQDLIKGLGNINTPTPTQHDQMTYHYSRHNENTNPDLLMIDRVLKKHPLPNIESTIVWDTPIRQIDTLVNILGIDSDMIAEYYIKNLDANAILQLVKLKLTSYIEQIANGTEEKVEPQTIQSEDSKPSPRPKKRVTKNTTK